MLSDFLTLEVYFGAPESAQYFEDLVKRYGQKCTLRALKQGDITCRHLCLNSGKLAVWLTDQGRHKAAS